MDNRSLFYEDELFQDSLFDELLNDLEFEDDLLLDSNNNNYSIGKNVIADVKVNNVTHLPLNTTGNKTSKSPKNIFNTGNIGPDSSFINPNQLQYGQALYSSDALLPQPINYSKNINGDVFALPNSIIDSNYIKSSSSSTNTTNSTHSSNLPFEINTPSSNDSHKRKTYFDVTTPANSKPKLPRRSDALLHIPCNLFKAFNAGDMNKVKDIIKDVSIKKCALKTPALDKDIFGQENVIDLFQVISDTHPDAVWVAKKSQWSEQQGGAWAIQCNINFAGTRITSNVFNIKSTSSLLSGNSMYLFKKKHSSLLDEMDIRLLSEPMVGQIRKLEQSEKNLSLLGSGVLIMSINPENKVVKFDFNWKISSFMEADL